MVEHKGKEVVDVGKVGFTHRDADRAVAIETVAFLIAIQAVATAGNVNAPVVSAAESQLTVFVIFHGNQVT